MVEAARKRHTRDDFSRALSAHLKAHRKAKGLKLEPMAELMGYNGGPSVANIESDRSVASLPSLCRYAEALNMTLAELLEGFKYK